MAFVTSPCHFFDVNDILLACHQSKVGKKNSDGLLSSDAIINAPIEFHEFLRILINMPVAHGHIPSNWHTGTIIPLLKSGDLNKTCSIIVEAFNIIYSPFGKVFDLLVLHHCHGVHEINELQFGFKSHHAQKMSLPTISAMVLMYIHAQLPCRKRLT